MARVSDVARPQIPISTTGVKGSVSSSSRHQPTASVVPLPGSLNAHPSNAPQTSTPITTPSAKSSSVKPQKSYTREALAISPGDLEKIRDHTRSVYRFVKETESTAFKTDHRQDNAQEKAISAQASTRLNTLFGNDISLYSKINQEKGAFQDNSTGLYFEIHSKVESPAKSPTYVMVFPGSGIPGMADVQWKNNIRQITGTGGVPPAYRQAEQLVAKIKSHLPKGATLELAGHSLGGGIANYAGLKHDLKSTCFNAAALGKACLKDLGEIPRDRLEKQVHLRIKSDWLSSARFLEKFQKFSSSLIPYVPRQVGKVYVLEHDQTQGSSIMDRHFTTAFRDFYDQNKKEVLDSSSIDPTAFA